MNYKVMEGDCLASLRVLPPACINTCVTSPPYFGLRDYGVDGQIGLEETPDAYVSKLVNVFREVRRVLRDDGTLWLNLGDSYAAGRGGTSMPAETLAGGKGGKGDDTAHRGRLAQVPNGKNPNAPIATYQPHRNAGAIGLKHKDLIGIPWRVAFALQQDGWYLRQDIIWHKPNPMPESVRDRCTKAHEYIFLLSKSPKYYFDSEAIKVPASSSFAKDKRHLTGSNENNDKMGYEDAMAQNPKGPHRLFGKSGNKDRKQRPSSDTLQKGAQAGSVPWEGVTANKRSVWTVTTKPYKGAHFATFPPDLIEPCVLAGCPAGGVVLDPFAGSGTTLQVAVKHGRYGLGLELNPEYIKLIHERMEKINGTV